MTFKLVCTNITVVMEEDRKKLTEKKLLSCGKREFLDAEEIANAILFLASKEASGINGVILFVDGGIDALLRSERF